MYETFIQAVKAQRAIVVTPNRRLASFIKEQASQQVECNKKVWETLPAFALQDWLLSLWEHLELRGYLSLQLLNKTQALLRWETIIQGSETGKALFQSYATAKLAMEAWTTLHQWQATDLLAQQSDSLDESTFQEWATAYQEWLKEKQCLDDAQLIGYIIALLKRHGAQLFQHYECKKVVLYGFEEFSPLQKTLFSILQENDFQVTYEMPKSLSPKRIFRTVFPFAQQEWQACALWAKNLLRQGKKNIAIVTPHLTEQRHQIAKVFQDLLYPLHVCHPLPLVYPAVNISTGVPLVQYPIVLAALDCIRCFVQPITKLEYANLFISPFLFPTDNLDHQISTEEKKQRKLHACEIIEKMSLKQGRLQEYLREGKSLSFATDSIYRALEASLMGMDNPSVVKQFHEWRADFKQILAQSGWPGFTGLTSVEYQLVKKLEELLDELFYCDVVLAPCRIEKAFHTLQKLASNLAFQPETRNAPIQILGILEAAGQHFEFLWVMGLHSEAWPPLARPNPFLSFEVQRKWNMPHSSAQREMEYAKRVTERFKTSAQEVIFSYSQQEKEKNLEVSKLIKALPSHDQKEWGVQDEIVRCESYFSHPPELERFLDNRGPSLQTDVLYRENKTTKLNAYVLTQQALCPFKAFAEVRLGAKKNIVEALGVQRSEEGIMVHKILEKLFRSIKSQKAIKAYTETKFDTLIQLLVESTIGDHDFEGSEIYKAVQILKLKQLIKDYIMLEKSRAPFQVLQVEKSCSFNFKNIQFNVRMDRVDVNEAGEHFIIDYKTGAFSLDSLWTDPLSNAQLPLYFLAIGEKKPSAIMIAHLSTKGCAYQGISEGAVNLPGVVPLASLKNAPVTTWEALEAYWSSQLSVLIDRFYEGEATVSPLNKGICQYCDLGAFCRIKEQQHAL